MLGGGTDGNEVLTTMTGIVLIVILAVVGVTIVRIGQLLWLHLFVGLLVVGPIALKLASTGYRFARYYTRDAAYLSKGPPWTPLRLIAPIVALSTLAVIVTGLVLLFGGPSTRQTWLLLHKVSFIVWVAFTALHVLGHLPEVGRLTGVRAELFELPGADASRTNGVPGAGDISPAAVISGPGSRGRLLALTASLVLGLILALALIPDFHAWTAAQPFFHHHHFQ